MRGLLLAGVLLLAGCDDFGELARLKPRRVPVKLVDTYRLLDGGVTTAVPNATVEAWVDVENADWVHIEGTCDAGECELRNVPPGTLLLRRSDDNLYAEVDGSESYDMGKDGYYRPYVQAGRDTRLTVTLTGAAPLSPRTWLQLRLPHVPVSTQNRRPVMNGFMPEMPSGTPGATSFSFQFSWQTLPVLRMEPAEVYQLEPTSSSASLTRWELAKRGVAPSVSIVDGRDVGVTAPLENVAAGGSLPGVSYDFARLVSEVERLTNVTVLGAMSLIDVAPAGDSAAVTVAAEYRTAAPWTLATAGVAIDPFPGRPMTVSHTLMLWYQRQLGTSTSRIPLTALISGPADTDGWHGTTLLGPPLDIEAAPTVEDGVLQNLTPALSWSPPAFGTANRYWVIIIDATPTPEVTLPQLFVLYRPRMRIPPGVLEGGKLYSFWVWAVNCDAAPLNAPLHEPPQPTCGSAQAATRAWRTPR